MIKIGLTGGIAAGKSTVTKYLDGEGFLVIDADRVVHELSAPKQPIWRYYVELFGEGILQEGELNRKEIGRILFQDKEKLVAVNKALHPIILAELVRRAEEISGGFKNNLLATDEQISEIENKKEPIVFFDVPLLFESGFF